MSTESLNQEWFGFPGTKDNYRTMVYYPGTGGDTFEFNFEGGYINRTDIKAFMVKDDTRDTEYLTLTFKGPNTVQTNKPVLEGWTVCIFRDTPKAEPLAKYQDGAVITAENLDRNAQQAMFAVSEMVDRFDSTVSQVDIALKAVYEATQTADEALAEAKKATGIAQSAVTKADSAITTSDRAEVTANAASQKAEHASQTAIDAKNTATALDGQIKSANATAQAANQTAADAKRIAEGVDGKATQAQSDAAAAVNTATEAKQVAQSIDAKATQAQKDAAEALKKANEVESSVGTVQALSNRVKEFKEGDGVEWKGSHIFNSRVTAKRSTGEYGYLDVMPTYTSLNHGANSDTGELRVGRNVLQYNGSRVPFEGITDFKYSNTLSIQSTYQPSISLMDTTRGTKATLLQDTDGLPALRWEASGAIRGTLYVPAGNGTVATQEWANDALSKKADTSKLGTAAGKNTGTSPGDVMEVGAFGVGKSAEFSQVSSSNPGNPFTGIGASVLRTSDSITSTKYNSQLYWPNGGKFRLVGATTTETGDFGGSYEFYSTGNTIVDGSGFIKTASPIIKIYPAGNYETNDESEGAEVRRTGTGQYHITGILGYNSDGAWGVNGGISVPKDNNGLELVYVEDRVQKDGSIIIETCHRQHAHLPERFQNWRLKEVTQEGERIFYQDGEPCDLPESTRLDVRVEMPSDSVWNLNNTPRIKWGGGDSIR